MLIKMVFTCAVLFLSALSAGIRAESPPNTDPSQYFTHLISVIKPPHSQLAISAIDIDSGKSIFKLNEHTLFVPASTQKLMTAVAATAQLSADFSFDTALYTQLPIRNGKILGDLYLRFSGDPTLTSDDLRRLFQQLTEQGLHEIAGDLYLVGQAEEQLKAPGWVWDDLGICYAAPVSRYVINQNCILAQLQPQLANSQAKLSFASYLPVTLSTSAYFDKNKQLEFCELELQRLPKNRFHISGCFPGERAVKLAIAISEPDLYAQQLVTGLIKSVRLKVKGKVKLTNSMDKRVKLIALHRSAPLASLIETMLLTSDNLIADSLFKAIGESYYKLPGNFTYGAKAMTQILTDAGVDLTHSQILDGSGLSRYNLLSASQLSQILALIHRDQRFRHLIDMLPVAGRSGTLRYKSKYNQEPLKDKVIAKTGTMQGVDNLAGFLWLDRESQVMFVILENGQSPKAKQEQLAPFSALFLQTLLDNRTNLY